MARRYTADWHTDPTLTCLDGLAFGDFLDIEPAPHTANGQETYALNRPKLVTAQSVSIRGWQVGGTGTQLRTHGHFQGRSVVFAPPGVFVPKLASLVPGPGYAFPLGYFDGAGVGENYYLNLKDVDACYWGGQYGFHLSLWYRPLQPPGVSASIAHCGGRLLQTDPIGLSWQIGHHAIDAPFAYFTAGGVTHYLHGQAGTLQPGQNYHLELDYDGSTVWLYLNGVAVMSAAASGPVRHESYFDTIVGPQFTSAKGVGLQMYAARGVIDALRISRIPRHAGSPFTPVAAKPEPDVDDNIVLNFEEPVAVAPGTSNERFTVGRTRASQVPCWLPLYDSHPLVPYRYRTNISGLAFECVGTSAPLFMHSVETKVSDCWFHFTRNGPEFWDNCFCSAVRDCTVNCNAQNLYPIGNPPPGAALAFTGAGMGVLDVSTFFAIGGGFGLLNYGGNGLYRRLFMTPAPETIAAVCLVGGGSPNNLSELAGLYLDDENAPPVAPRASVILEGLAGLEMRSSVLEPVQHGAAPVILIGAGNGDLTFSGLRFTAAAGCPGLFKTLAPPKSAVVDGHAKAPVGVHLEDATGLTGVVVDRRAAPPQAPWARAWRALWGAK